MTWKKGKHAKTNISCLAFWIYEKSNEKNNFFPSKNSSKTIGMFIEHLIKEIELVVTEKEFASGDQIKLIALFGNVDSSDFLCQENNRNISKQNFGQKCKLIDWDLDVRNQACS